MASKDNVYQNTISRLARKYSSTNLPGPSELIGDQSADHHDMALIEEDHELNDAVPQFADLHTVRVHDVPNHHAPSSAASAVGALGVNPMDEIRGMAMSRDLFLEVFDKYFDETADGDVDRDEFDRGLNKLGIALSDEQRLKLFGVLLKSGGDVDDDDDEQYLGRDSFADFLLRRFEAPQLRASQDVLLRAIAENGKKNEDRHRLMMAEDAAQWDSAEVSLAETEMLRAMEQMAATEMEKIHHQQALTHSLTLCLFHPDFDDKI